MTYLTPLRIRILSVGSLMATMAYGSNLRSEVALPSLFTNHMVLQQEMNVPVWGWAEPGETVHVSVAGQTHQARADDQGDWRVNLTPLKATHDPQTLVVEASNRIAIKDVLVGEVWVCSGQSNMQWPVSASWNSDLAILSAKHPHIRLLTVDTAGIQKPMEDFSGEWHVCSPTTVGGFSGVGYNFGLLLNEILDVPVGLIENAWGGSSCEAWVERHRLEDHPDQYKPLLSRWAETEAQADLKSSYEKYEAALLKWQDESKAAKKRGEAVPREPRRPNNRMVTQHRPGNLFNGRVAPLTPFAIRGVIWYQGESNASRAYQYRHLFPLMIQNWRDAWQQGDFPFYWVQLADFREEKGHPFSSDWAELREAQTITQDQLPNTGEAVIIDLGEAADIHPRNKQEVGSRLARLALANDYGLELAARSPRFDELIIKGGRARLTFKHQGGGLRTVDQRDLLGFTIAGADRQWHNAQAKILEDGSVEVWHVDVGQPVAVRYAWADNPICNLFSQEGLPVTPFRTDDWPGVTAKNR